MNTPAQLPRDPGSQEQRVRWRLLSIPISDSDGANAFDVVGANAGVEELDRQFAPWSNPAPGQIGKASPPFLRDDAMDGAQSRPPVCVLRRIQNDAVGIGRKPREQRMLEVR